MSSLVQKYTAYYPRLEVVTEKMVSLNKSSPKTYHANSYTSVTSKGVEADHIKIFFLSSSSKYDKNHRLVTTGESFAFSFYFKDLNEPYVFAAWKNEQNEIVSAKFSPENFKHLIKEWTKWCENSLKDQKLTKGIIEIAKKEYFEIFFSKGVYNPFIEAERVFEHIKEELQKEPFNYLKHELLSLDEKIEAQNKRLQSIPEMLDLKEKLFKAEEEIKRLSDIKETITASIQKITDDFYKKEDGETKGRYFVPKLQEEKQKKQHQLKSEKMNLVISELSGLTESQKAEVRKKLKDLI